MYRITKFKWVSLTIFLLSLYSTSSFAANWQKATKVSGGYGLQVELIENNDGTVTMFYIEPDKEVVYKTQSKKNSNEWSKKKSLEIYANQIKLGKHADGRIEVFAIGIMASVVSHITQLKPNSDEWSKEKMVKGVYATQIELASNQDGSLMMVFIKPSKEISYIKQTKPNSEECTANKDLESYASQIALASHEDGRLEIAIIGTMAYVMSHQTQLKPNSDEWSKEIELKGIYGRQVEFAMNANGKLALFYIKPDREVAYLLETNSAESAWSKPHNLEAYANLIELGHNQNGTIELVMVGTFGNVLTQMTQKEASTNEWSKEKDMKSYATQMRLINNSNDHLSLVYVAPVSTQIHSSIQLD